MNLGFGKSEKKAGEKLEFGIRKIREKGEQKKKRKP